jgi:hypothetical protein
MFSTDVLNKPVDKRVHATRQPSVSLVCNCAWRFCDRFVTLAVAIALAACGAGPAADDPVGVTRAFIETARRGDCMTLWSYFSRGTQENIEGQVREALRYAEYPTDLTPQTRHCPDVYAEALPGTALLVSQDADAATVQVTFAEGSRLALIPFLSTKYREWQESLQLVREDARWKIDRPRAEVRTSGAVIIGDTYVRGGPGGDARRYGIEVEGILKGDRKAVEAQLMDPLAWPRFMPLIKDVEPVSGPDKDGGWTWRVRIQASQGPPAVATVRIRPYGRLRDERLPWTTVQWSVEDHNDRASTPENPLFTGSWKLRPRYQGTWVTLGLVFQDDEWPPEIPREWKSPDVIARAIAALDRAAGAP